MRFILKFVLACVALGVAAKAVAQQQVLDACDTLDAWKVIASDGVVAKISRADGLDGGALRLDFDFQSGSGFCVIRRDVQLSLPENYRFSVALRGSASPNTLEFKLVDPSGDNVWWVPQRSFEFPTDWRTLRFKARQFRFAWGPSGGTPLEQIGAIEIAVAAATGGQGHILIDNLTFERLPEPQPVTQLPVAHFSSGTAHGESGPTQLAEVGLIEWVSAPDDRQPFLRLDFQQAREFGGLALDWGNDDFATAYEIELSLDGQAWESVATIAGADGGREYIPLRDAEARQLRVTVRETSRGQGVRVQHVRLLSVDFAETPNNMFSTIAREQSRGRLPRYFLGEQTPWTVVGVANDEKEALIDIFGALEVDKLRFRIEPFLYIDGRLVTWADVESTPSLADDYLPIPSVTWLHGDLELVTTALAAGDAGASTLYARYQLMNRGAQPVRGTLFLAVRPFQVLPPWQELNITGGACRVESLAWDGQRLAVNDDKVVVPWTKPAAFGAMTFAQGDITEYLAAERLPGASAVQDPTGWASGALRYDFALGPQAQATYVVAVPFHGKIADVPANAEARYAEIEKDVRALWSAELNRAKLTLPASAAQLVNTFRTTQAYILINADGPSIQPGSRSYERSWIRDGALTSTALLYTGHRERARAFADWYAGYQFPSGKVPCVVDRRGPDPVPEHDSTGEFIYLLRKYYHFTHDRALLERHLPRVIAGVDYIEALRQERMTPEYRDGPPEKRACYGLVPESISHEGYSAKPMHSYWDSFFTLRGLKDATTIAQILERPELEERFRALRDDYRKCLYDSLRLAMELKHVDYIPGCVELGDFDATSTAIAIFPCGELEALPQPALTNTFDRYYDFFCQRRDTRPMNWDNYTPYEIRIVGTLVRLGQPDRVHALLDFFFGDQRPQGWNHWAEVVWSNPATPKFIGDMPHTWVGSDYISAVRSLFVYERESDVALVLAAGVRPEWLTSPDGVAIADFPTEHGALAYTLKLAGDELVCELKGTGTVPPGGLVLHNPLARPIRAATLDGQPAELLGDHDVKLTALTGRVVLTLAP